MRKAVSLFLVLITLSAVLSACNLPANRLGLSTALSENSSLVIKGERASDNLVPETDGTVSLGITYTLIEKGHYIVSGTTERDNCWFSIINNLYELPEGFVPGETYYLRYFTDDFNLIVRVLSYDANLEETLVASMTESGEFTLPENAVGINVRVATNYQGTYYPGIHFEIGIFNMNNQHIEDIMGYNWLPRPMLTIIDDDGFVSFLNDLMPIVIQKNVTLSSANVTLFTEYREVTEAYLSAKERLEEGTITQAEYEEVKERFDAVRAYIGYSEHSEDFGLNFMNWDEIKYCYENGAEILSHSYSHNMNIQYESEELIQREFQMSKNILQEHGILSEVLVYCGGTGYCPNVQRACSRVFDYGIKAGGDVVNHAGENRYGIHRYGVASDGMVIRFDMDTILPQLKALAYSRTGWMIWTIHTSSSLWGEDTARVISDTVDYARMIHLPIVSATHGCKSYYGDR